MTRITQNQYERLGRLSKKLFDRVEELELELSQERFMRQAAEAEVKRRYLVVDTAFCECGTCQEIRRQQGR